MKSAVYKRTSLRFQCRLQNMRCEHAGGIVVSPRTPRFDRRFASFIVSGARRESFRLPDEGNQVQQTLIPFNEEHAMKRSAHFTTMLVWNALLMCVQGAEPEYSPEPGFVSLFNGKSLDGWIGAKETYQVEDGMIVSLPEKGGNLLTEKEYSDFIIRFEFLLTPGANNGIGLRVPAVGAHAATQGMEIQLLDELDARYKQLKPYQFHGSVYGIIPARTGHLKPVGDWNSQEIRCIGKQVTVILNDQVIVDGNIVAATQAGAMDEREHPGVERTAGHIGLLGHQSVVKFRKIRVQENFPQTSIKTSP